MLLAYTLVPFRHVPEQNALYKTPSPIEEGWRGTFCGLAFLTLIHFQYMVMYRFIRLADRPISRMICE